MSPCNEPRVNRDHRQLEDQYRLLRQHHVRMECLMESMLRERGMRELFGERYKEERDHYEGASWRTGDKP